MPKQHLFWMCFQMRLCAIWWANNSLTLIAGALVKCSKWKCTSNYGTLYHFDLQKKKRNKDQPKTSHYICKEALYNKLKILSITNERTICRTNTRKVCKVMAMFDISLVRRTKFHLLVTWKIMTIVKNTLSASINKVQNYCVCAPSVRETKKNALRSMKEPNERWCDVCELRFVTFIRTNSKQQYSELCEQNKRNRANERCVVQRCEILKRILRYTQLQPKSCGKTHHSISYWTKRALYWRRPNVWVQFFFTYF